MNPIAAPSPAVIGRIHNARLTSSRSVDTSNTAPPSRRCSLRTHPDHTATLPNKSKSGARGRGWEEVSGVTRVPPSDTRVTYVVSYALAAARCLRDHADLQVEAVRRRRVISLLLGRVNV